jgi:hypothetical protein
MHAVQIGRLRSSVAESGHGCESFAWANMEVVYLCSTLLEFDYPEFIE